MTLEEKIRGCFEGMVVYKDPSRTEFFKSLSLPSFLRDWIIMHFADEQGRIDIDEINDFVKKNIPRRENWELLKSRMVRDGERVRFLAKLRVEIDVKTGETLFSLPDMGFPTRKSEAIVKPWVLQQHRDYLLADSETWGVVELEWSPEGWPGRKGRGQFTWSISSHFGPIKLTSLSIKKRVKSFLWKNG